MRVIHVTWVCALVACSDDAAVNDATDAAVNDVTTTDGTTTTATATDSTTLTTADATPTDVTPDAAPPETVTVSMTAASGGSITTASGDAKLTVPAGALPQDTTLTLTVGPATADTAGPVYDFGPDGLEFATPATIDLAIPRVVPEGQTAAVATRIADAWVDVEGSTAADGRVTAPVSHFSTFAVVFRTNAGVIAPTCTGAQLNGFPCGGDPKGGWIIDTVCTPAPATLACPADGDITFTGDGRVVVGDTTASFTLTSATLAGDVTIPLATCPMADGCGILQGMLGALGASCADAAGNACRCTFSKGLTPIPGAALPYTIDGDALVVDAGAGGTHRVPFCKDLLNLTLRVPTDLIEGLVQGWSQLGAAFLGGEAPDLVLAGFPCAPQCDGRVCGPDGCGGHCGQACQQGQVCTESGQCEVGAEVTCAEILACFDTVDPTGCVAALDFPAPPSGAPPGATHPEIGYWYALAACNASFTSGFPGCEDHPCTDPDFCNNSPLPGLNGATVRLGCTPCELQRKACVATADCVPDCAGKTCGGDGCRGQCGTCQAGQSCKMPDQACIPNP